MITVIGEEADDLQEAEGERDDHEDFLFYGHLDRSKEEGWEDDDAEFEDVIDNYNCADARSLMREIMRC